MSSMQKGRGSAPDRAHRVGVVIHSLTGGGAEQVARAWMSALASAGREVVLYTYGAPCEAPEGVVAHRHFPGTSVASRWVRLPGWLRTVALEDRVDVLLGVLDFSNVMATAAMAGTGVPVVISEHSVPSLLWRTKGAGGVAKHALARLLYPRADAAITVSHAAAADLAGHLHVPSDRLYVVPNGIAQRSGEAAVDAAASHTPVASPALAEATTRLVLVGRLVGEKNFAAALEAAAELRRRGEGVGVLVLGDGPLQAALTERAAQLGVPTEFAGWVQDWRAHVRPGADVVVLPSRVEGLGNVLVEAAAAGVASVAASSALGVGDAIIPGVTGVLARSTRASDLADAVHAARQLDVASAVPAGWLEQFGAANVQDSLLAVLDQASSSRIDAPDRLVVLSPHLDDAVLSAGATISAAVRHGVEVVVATVFAGLPDATLAADGHQRHAGFATALEAANSRRAEDAAACRALGATPVWGSLIDHEDAPRSLDAVLAECQAVLRPGDVVLAPGWPRLHPDHDLVAQAGERLRELGWPVATYMEQPYAAWQALSRPAALGGPKERNQTPARETTGPAWARTSPRDDVRKWRALSFYASQLKVLHRMPRARIAGFEAARGGESIVWAGLTPDRRNL